MRPHRRDVLSLGALGFGLGVAGVSPRRRAADLDELAARIGRTPREELSRWLARQAAAGLAREDVLGACFLLGLREIRTGPVGNALHSVMVVESVARTTGDAPRGEAWEASLWLADDVREGMEMDARRGDWSLTEPRPAALDVPAAQIELRLALYGFDPERAERAAATLFARGASDAAFDALRACAARSLRDAGHRIVHQAQCERMLARIGACHGEPVLRSLAVGLASDAEGPATASWSRALELAPRLSDRWNAGAEVPEKSLEVLRALRGRDADDSQDAVFAAFEQGLGPLTVWDGLRLYAAEPFWLRPDRAHLFPVHTTTELEALAWGFERCGNDALRRAWTLQAAAWLAQVREAVADNHGAYPEGPGIDALAAEPGSLEAALAGRSTPDAIAALELSPQDLAPFLAALRARLVPRTTQNHQHKLLAAVVEESARTHPRWRARVAAPAVDFVPGVSEPESDFALRARAALREAGLY